MARSYAEVRSQVGGGVKLDCFGCPDGAPLFVGVPFARVLFLATGLAGLLFLLAGLGLFCTMVLDTYYSVSAYLFCLFHLSITHHLSEAQGFQTPF